MALALLIGVTGGLVMGTAIGARRTATAPDRLRASVDGRVDVQILDLGSVEPQAVEGLAMVERFAVSRFLVADVEYDLTVTTDQTFAAQLVEGEVDPGDPLAAVLDGTTARTLGVGVGDEVDLALYSAAQWEAQDPSGGPQGPHVSARVAGLIREPADLDAADPRSVASQGNDGTFALPASFLDQFGDQAGLFTNVFTSVQLRGGRADVPAFKTAVRALPGGDRIDFLDADETQSQTAARRAVRVQAVGLGLLAAALALVAAVTVGQLLHRHLRSAGADASTLQALGMTSGELARIGLVRGVVLAGISAPVALVTAVAVSRFTPVGVARQGEPSPGVDVNVLWLAGGILTLALMVTLVAALSGARSSPSSAARTPPGARPGGGAVGAVRRHAGAVLAAALALSFGTRSARLAGRAATAALAVATITVVGGAVLIASFDRVEDAPARYGWTFDAAAGNPYEEDPGDLFEVVEQTPGVESAAGAAGVSLEVDGHSLSLLAVDGERGIELRPIEGRAPAEADEIALGRRTLADLDVSIGDTVTLDSGNGGVELTVTGTIVVPELTGLDTGLGRGGVLTLGALERISPDAQPNLVLLNFHPGERDRAVEAFTNLSQDVHPLVEPYLPAALYQFVRVRQVLTLLGALVVLLGFATLVHSILGGGYQRRRQLSILRSLGFTRSQMAAAALYHGAACTAAALIVGLPLGVAAGRLAWTAVGDRLGLPDAPAVPIALLAVLVPAGLAVGIASAAGPGWWEARNARAPMTREV